MQATAGSDGRVLFYDSAGFCSAGASGIVCPAAAQLVAAPGPAIRTLHWEPGAVHGTCLLNQYIPYPMASNTCKTLYYTLSGIPYLMLVLAPMRAAICMPRRGAGCGGWQAPDFHLSYQMT